MKRSFIMGLCFVLSIVLFTSCNQTTIPDENIGSQYVKGSDDQYNFILYKRSGGYPMAESEDAVYLLKNSRYLYAVIKKTGDSIPLCNKPDCMHDKTVGSNSIDNLDCNACFPVAQDIVYYQGKLYVSVENSGIYEIDASGTTRRQLLPPQKGILRMIVHRGYLYIATSDFIFDWGNHSQEEMKEMACRIERYRLNPWDGKPETVYEIKGQDSQINQMYAYGNRLWFVVNYLKRNQVYIYDMTAHTVTEEPKEISNGTIIGDRMLVFEVPEGYDDTMSSEEFYQLQEKNMGLIKDFEGNLITQTEIPASYEMVCGYSDKIAADNMFSVISKGVPKEERSVRFYNTEGKLIREVKTENDTMPSLGMNEDYFFYMKRADNDQGYDVWAIDLHKLDDPNLKGEPFFVSEE